MRMVGPLTSGIAAGVNGSATANDTSPIIIRGKIHSLYVLYGDSPPATTDVTIATVGTSPDPPALTILTLTDANTSGWFMPRHGVCSNAGVALTYDGTRVIAEPPAIADKVKITIAQANASDYVYVWLMLYD